jgi:hypothetical protein
MTGPGQPPGITSPLGTFAIEAARLDSEAWERIASRCALLDLPTLSGLFGRAGLFAHSVVPAANPYTAPFVQPAMALLGMALGMLTELSVQIAPPRPEVFEDAAERECKEGPAAGRDPQLVAFLTVQGLAQRQQRRHPGTASALRAISFALMARSIAGQARLAELYSPFEPEIPFASLSAGAGSHAA